MKKLFSLIIVAILVLTPFISDGAVRVKGYYRKDGTYVQPHYRSNPDGNPYNNWSYPGNVNPYTGKVAPGNPSTYLDNYYNNSSSYSLPSYSSGLSLPSSIPSLPKTTRHVSFMAKSYADNYPDKSCLSSNSLTNADAYACYDYKTSKDSYNWIVTNPSSEYAKCGNTYYYVDACAAGTKVVCTTAGAICQSIANVNNAPSLTTSTLQNASQADAQRQELIRLLILQIVALQQQLNALMQK